MGLSDSQNQSNILIKSIDNSITGPQPGDLLNISQYKCEGNTHYTRRAMWGIAPQVKVRLRIISPADPCPVMGTLFSRRTAWQSTISARPRADAGLKKWCPHRSPAVSFPLAEQFLDFRDRGSAAGSAVKNILEAMLFNSGPYVQGTRICVILRLPNHSPVVSPVKLAQQGTPGAMTRAGSLQSGRR